MTSLSESTAGACDIDPRWEFNAPKYVDLSKLPADGLPEDDGADAWFESPEALAVLKTPRRPGAAAPQAAAQAASPAAASTKKRSAVKSASKWKSSSAKEAPAEGQEAATEQPLSSRDAETKGPVTRLMAKLAAVASPVQAAKETPARDETAEAGRGQAKETEEAQPGPGSAGQGEGTGKPGKETAAQRLARWKAAGATENAKEKRRAAGAAADDGKVPENGKQQRRRASAGDALKQSEPTGDAKGQEVPQTAKKGTKRARPAETKTVLGTRVTIPKSPKLRSSARVRGPSTQLTSEELAMQAARREAEQEAKRRKLQNERAHKIHGAVLQQQPAAAAAAAAPAAAEAEGVRGGSRAMVTRSMAGTAEPFVSLAERLRAMETKTPERFKAPAAAPGPKTARPSTAATPRALSPLTTAPRAPSTPH